MSKLRDLYQEVIIDHNRSPRNFRKLPQANHIAEGFNPLCGDKLTLYILAEGGVIKDICFEGAGCAISTASASLMTEQLKGKTETQAHALFTNFHNLLTKEALINIDKDLLGKLAVLEGVREYPARIKCATLAWHALEAALSGKEQTITTE